MKTSKINTLFCILVSPFAFCQVSNDAKIIQGKIISNSSSVSEIEVVNILSEKSVKVDDNGEFQIAAKEDDVLVFVSKTFEPYQKTIDCQAYETQKIEIEMIPKGIELNEVIINQYAGINARELGIISKNQKRYTVAERRLASNSGGIGGLINTLSGRKEMLKKELEIETKETNLSKLKKMFDTSYYLKSCHISADKIIAFQYYCIENKNFERLINTGNRGEILFYMLQLAITFNELQIDVIKS